MEGVIDASDSQLYIPTFGLLLPPVLCADLLEEEDVRGCVPGPGDIVLADTVGGGPGSAPGDLRAKDPGAVGACIMSLYVL